QPACLCCLKRFRRGAGICWQNRLKLAGFGALPHTRSCTAARLQAGFNLAKLSWDFVVPIYVYKCSDCGHTQDVLQKMSDPVLTDCPECGHSTYAKQVTSAGFQLKGTGWYVTDFRNNGKAPQGDTSAPAASTPASSSAGSTP